LWRGFLAEAGSDDVQRSFEVPEGISEGYVTLADAGWGSECGQREVFLEGTEPDGNDCGSFDFPRWEIPREWGSALRRQAERLLQGLLSEQRERGRSQR
jgi:hypothetical protein